MNYDLAKVVLDAFSFIMALSAMVFAWLSGRRKDLDARLDQGAEQMRSHDARIDRLEQTVANLPGTKDVHRLEMMLSDLGGDMKAMRAEMKGMSESMTRTENIVTRHEDHLQENK